MKKLLLPLALVAGFSSLHAGTLDLTPRYIDTEIDSYRARQLYILEDSTKIGISHDTETTVASEGGQLVFRFPKLSDATYRIGHSPLSPKDAFDDAAALEKYRAAALGLAPAGTTEVKLIEEATNPLPINEWTSHGFVLSYQAGANVTKLSVTFLNVNPTTQLLLVTRAPSGTFAEAADRSYHIIRTWHEVQPGDIAGTRRD